MTGGLTPRNEESRHRILRWLWRLQGDCPPTYPRITLVTSSDNGIERDADSFLPLMGRDT